MRVRRAHERGVSLARNADVIGVAARAGEQPQVLDAANRLADRKSTRLNSSHQIISYAVFCLKKKRNDTRRNGNVDAWRGIPRSPEFLLEGQSPIQKPGPISLECLDNSEFLPNVTSEYLEHRE